MSELSAGSKATTNLFIVLGVVALIALAVSVGSQPPQPANCGERLQTMGNVVWDPYGPVIHPGEAQTVTLDYIVTATAKLENISVISEPSKYDEVAIRALKKARYRTAEGAPPLNCSYTFTLRLD